MEEKKIHSSRQKKIFSTKSYKKISISKPINDYKHKIIIQITKYIALKKKITHKKGITIKMYRSKKEY